MRDVGEWLFKLQKWPRHVLARVHRGHALLAEATSSSSSVTGHALLAEATSSSSSVTGHALLAEATSSSSSVTSHALLHGPLPLPQLIVKHDTARVFQCMLQHGTAQQRSSLFGELEGKSCGGGWGMWKWAGPVVVGGCCIIGVLCGAGCLKDLVKLRYAKHLVLKILKHG